MKQLARFIFFSKIFGFLSKAFLSRRRTWKGRDFLVDLSPYKSFSSQMFFKIGVLKNFGIFTGKPVLGPLFNKVAGLNACNFIKKRLQHSCLPVNIAKF